MVKNQRIYNKFTGQQGVVLVESLNGFPRYYVRWDDGSSSSVWSDEVCSATDYKSRDKVWIQ